MVCVLHSDMRDISAFYNLILSFWIIVFYNFVHAVDTINVWI